MNIFREWDNFSIEIKKLSTELRTDPEKAKVRLTEVEKDFNDLVSETKTLLG